MRIFIRFSFMLALLLVIACNSNKESNESNNTEPAKDTHSFANADKISVSHIHLDLNVDFDKSVLRGMATLSLQHHLPADTLWLDTRGLNIFSVTLNNDTSKKINYYLGATTPFKGSALGIPVNKTTQTVQIKYQTTEESVALQWLTPEQTAGKDFPFLFTQSEANLARSWVPCQDSPGVRFTYSADITVPPNMLALMSAENPQKKNDSGKYHFEMKEKIPAYLMALAVGNIEFLATGQRTGVYSEPAMVHKAVVEFSEMDDMVKTAEMLYGPYRWGRFDVIVLPPAFPFGGMENPRLTFLTPTLVVGDKSLTAVVAHELAHSWSGNLVTNATWNDFWLNEGFTVYFERRIIERLKSKDFADMQAVLGRQDLEETLEDLKSNPEDTRLKLNLENRDPDDGMSDVAYEKGYLFLRLIEETAGREKFDNFLTNYFNEFAFTSMTTEKFIHYLKENLLNDKNGLTNKVNIDEWVYNPGIPANCPIIVSEKFKEIDNKVAEFMKGSSAASLNLYNVSTNEWLHFMDALPLQLSMKQLTDLDSTYGFTDSGNAEILCKWLRKCIAGNYSKADETLEYFLMHTGRRKFVKPLFSELAKTPEGLEKAKKIYEKAKPNYHALLIATLEQILEKQMIKV
ncbi:MAG: M1 family metallopeptidase [Bacteroidia bacterium]|nr:M1 family metallopeptidase [Bacteroidia bacterium]MCZ2248398.1 M1 family metallopeptidase [Bacteroidia bacterium]